MKENLYACNMCEHSYYCDDDMLYCEVHEKEVIEIEECDVFDFD